MKAHINRIISLLLVAVLTVPICTNTLKTAERFEVVQTLKAQGNYYPDVSRNSVLPPAVQRLKS